MFFGDAGSRLTAALLAAALLCGADGGALAAEGDACDLDGGSGNGKIILGGANDEHCVALEKAAAFLKCREARWGTTIVALPIVGGISVFCHIRTRDFAGDAGMEDAGSCLIFADQEVSESRPCSEVFGAELNFPENDDSGEQRFIYNCPEHMGPDPAYVSGGVQGCIPLNAEGVCDGLFGGEVGEEVDEGVDERICSGVDAVGTFCIVGSRVAFPCRGLFRHVWRCNSEYNRPAQNPFICGPRCDPETPLAKGAKCIVPSDN